MGIQTSNPASAAGIPLAYLDTDVTLAANSDEKVPSQKAVKTYVDANAGGTAKSILGITGRSSAGGFVVGGGFGPLYASPIVSVYDSQQTGAAESDCAFVMPYDCTLRNLKVRTGSTAASGSPVTTVMVRKNEATTPLTLTVTETINTTSSDSTHSVAFSAGDRLTVSVENGAGEFDSNAGIISISIEVDSP